VVTIFALVLVLFAVRTRRALVAFVVVMALGVLGQVAFGAIQSLLALGPASFAVTASVFRAYGTFGKPNTYAGYLEMTGPLLLAVGMWAVHRARGAWNRYRAVRESGMGSSAVERREFTRWAGLTVLLAVSGVASLAGIVLSFSRGAWLGVAAGILAMLMVSARRLPILRLVVVAVIAITFAAGGVHYAPTAIQDRYEQLVSQIRLFDSREARVTPATFATVQRMAMWQTGLAMYSSDPLLGVGVGNFNYRFTAFHIHSGFPTSAGQAHNYYIQALAETGLVGLITYLALMGTALATCVRTARAGPDGLTRAIGIGAVGVTSAVMVHNVVEDLHVLNLGIQLAAVWGLAIVAMRIAEERAHVARTRPDLQAD
ncbi:MAG TPA: O-antigen ligase family protein, partial [Thermomicrobiaceae bacterium]|nr:O-antigen ligase family protein [Thermomicrobiaceae bacterium]